MNILIYKLLLFFNFIILGILFLFCPEDINKFYIFSCLITVLFSLVFFYRIKVTQNNRFILFSVTTFFLLSYIIVHFQIPIIELFGISIKSNIFYFIWANDSIINKSIIISSLGILSFMIGSCIIEKKNIEITNIEIKYRTNKSILLLIIPTYIFYFLFFITSGSYSSGAYYAGDQLGMSNYFFSAFNIFLGAILITRLYYISSITKKNINIISYLRLFGMPILMITLWHIAFSFYVGDRGPVLVYGTLLFSLFFTRFHRFKFIYLIVFFLLVGPVMNLMSQARSRYVGESYLERMKNAQMLYTEKAKILSKFESDNIFMPQTVELAYSIRCLNHAIYSISSLDNYFFGYFQIRQIVSSIPGAGGIFLKIFGENNKKYDGSSSYITFLIQGNYPKYGDGTTVTADLYLDFGILGVIVGCLLFGVFLSKYEPYLFNGRINSILLWIILLLYLSSALSLGRSTFLHIFQKVFMIYAVIIINDFIINKLSYNE